LHQTETTTDPIALETDTDLTDDYAYTTSAYFSFARILKEDPPMIWRYVTAATQLKSQAVYFDQHCGQTEVNNVVKFPIEKSLPTSHQHDPSPSSLEPDCLHEPEEGTHV